MRIWVISFLILLFTGISSVAALSVEQSNTNETPLSSSLARAVPVLSQAVFSHHDKCCNNSGDQAKSVKVSSCQADCTSLLPSMAEFVFQACIEHETTPMPVFSALIIYPKEQPPKVS